MKCYRAKIGYAEDENLPKETVRAYNGLSQAYAHAQDYARALVWTHLALRVDPRNVDAKRDLAVISERLKAWPTSPTGIYIRYAGRALWNTLCVTEAQDGKIHFRLVAFRISPAWRELGPGAYGDIDGDAVRANDRDVYELRDFEDFPECRVRMKFKPDAATVFEPVGDCGFGAEVRAAGQYERITATPTTLRECRDAQNP
jgi:hypothetical protein